MKHEFVCDNCKKFIVHEDDFTTGYGQNDKDEKICFECCGLHDEQKLRSLKIGEKIWLYFSNGELSNWPGTFKLRAYHSHDGKHNIGRVRTDAWFKFNHNLYHGVNIGDSQCMKVTRIRLCN